MSRHIKTFAPRFIRTEEQNNDKEEQNKYQQITNQDAKIALSKTEVTKITYSPFKNRAFNKVEKGLSVMRFSNSGLHIALLNKSLNKLGYTTIPENETAFLDKTKTALINFQRNNGIKATGVLNAETLLKMDEVLRVLQDEKEDKLSIPERAKLLYEAFEHRNLLIFEATDEDKVFMALEKLSSEDRNELIKYYDENYRSKRKRGLVEDLYEELKEDSKELYKAIRLLYANYYENPKEESL